MSRQEAIKIINQLSDEQLQKLANYVKLTFIQKVKLNEKKLNNEQKELLDLLNYSIDSGRGDFAEKHDHYLYGENK
jgi:hypothetical protein